MLLLRDSLVDTFTSSEGPRVSGLEIEEGNHRYLELQTCVKIDGWRFQLDDLESLYGKWLVLNGCDI